MDFHVVKEMSKGEKWTSEISYAKCGHRLMRVIVDRGWEDKIDEAKERGPLSLPPVDDLCPRCKSPPES